MRKLVDDIGGIATPAQLLEIQKLWKNLEIKGGDKTAVSVAKAVKEVGLFVAESDNEDGPQEETHINTPEQSQVSLPSLSRIPQEVVDADAEEEEEGQISSHTSDTSDVELEVELSKRKLDDDVEETLTVQTTKRKRMIITDDEDDE